MGSWEHAWIMNHDLAASHVPREPDPDLFRIAKTEIPGLVNVNIYSLYSY